MEVYQDFKEFLELLNANKVEYLVVGAHALAFYGAPRFTGDLDILVRPEGENARKILKSLADFGFGSLKLGEKDFTQSGNVIQLGHPPVRIDIITSLTGVSWEEIESGKEPGTLGSVEVFYIGKKELIQNKRALGRKKDMADIEALDEQ